MEIPEDDTLYGLYQGTPLTERTWSDSARLPDRVTIFRRPIEEDAESEDDIVWMVGETVIHEFGHYFGLSEEEIEAIEERYWRARRGGTVKRAVARMATRTAERAAGEAAGAQALRPALSRTRLGRRVVAAIGPREGDVFVEIGPGPGALTLPLAATGARSAPSKSTATWPRRCAAPAAERDVVCADFLALRRRLLATRLAIGDASAPVRIVGNLPYNLSSPILLRLLDLSPRRPAVVDATVMLQREVADRVAAEPGGGDYGPLAHPRRCMPTGRACSRSRQARSARRPRCIPRWSGSPSALQPSVSATRRSSSGWCARSSSSGGRRSPTRSSPLPAPEDATGRARCAAVGLDGARRPETLQLQSCRRLPPRSSKSAHRDRERIDARSVLCCRRFFPAPFRLAQRLNGSTRPTPRSALRPTRASPAHPEPADAHSQPCSFALPFRSSGS